MGVTLGGFDELGKDLTAAAERLSATQGAGFMRSLLQVAAEPIYEQAKANAESLTQRSGRLAGSVKTYTPVHHRSGKGFSIKIGVGRGELGAAYAAPVEYGHGGPHGPAGAHPVVRPAYDAKKDEAYARIKKDILDELQFRGL